jgi:transcription antitermination factor NusG
MLIWSAVYTRARWEKKVYERLCARGVQCYLPLCKSRRRWSDRIVELHMPLFPSYLFVQIEPQSESIYTVADTPGVVRLVGQIGNHRPVAIPEDQIMAIKRIVQACANVDLHDGFKIGDKVRVVTGPLAGIEGVVEQRGRRNRLFVGVDGIDRSVVVEIDIADVAKV